MLVGVKIDEEDHCMTLFFSFPNSWDNLVMASGSTTNTLVLDEVVASLLLKEMRQKNFKSTNEALVFHGRLKEKRKKGEKGRSKSCGRHKSPGKSKEKCWNCDKVEHFRRHYKEYKNKNKKKNNDSDGESEKSSQESGEDSFVTTLVTHVGQSAWLIDTRASFHMNSH
jgi:hypothetical protein